MRMLLVSAAVALLAGPAAAQPIDIDMYIGSSNPAGGALKLAYQLCRPVVVTPSVTANGLTRWTSTQPGFNALATNRPGSIYVLRDNTPIEVELTALDPGVSLKVESALLDTVGASALIGNSPNMHLHPEWRLLLPEGARGEYHLAFRFHTSARTYGDSTPYTFTIATDAPAVDPCAGGTTTTTLPSSETDHLVSGTLLLLRTAPANPARKSMRLTFGGFDTGGADPTVTGGQLEVESNVGGFVGSYELPATGWRPRRAHGGLRGYRYTDRRGPIHRVEITLGRGVTAVGSGIGLAHVITQDPTPVEVTFTLGTQRACLHFGGTTTFKAGRMFRAENSPPPYACVP